ncbi:hypothetical protein ACHAXR_008658 [Thalassiosira sp. AJA248-18]
MMTTRPQRKPTRRRRKRRQYPAPVAADAAAVVGRFNKNNNAAASSATTDPYTILLSILLILITGPPSSYSSISFVSAGSNNNFCGTTWGDVSANCAKAIHCPNASDEECDFIPGHSCFGDTLCDASKGDGISAPPGLTGHPMASLPYEDQTLTRFCQGSRWNPENVPECTLDEFCGDESPCPSGMVCHWSDCHLHDVLLKEHENKAKQDELNQKEKLASLPEDDSIRFNSCGKDWTDADSRCGQWCWGEESDCPSGESCFGSTGCYNDAGLKPSPSPTTYAPTSKAPTVRSDPSNFRFCGIAWDKTICSVAGHCPIGDECKNGEICFTKQRCNIHDLTKEPTLTPSTSPTLPFDHPSYFKFCGKSYDHAASICSLRTRCMTDNNCPNGALCFEDLPGHCNAFYLKHPELRPTNTPTRSPMKPTPSRSPTPAPSASPSTHPPTRRMDPRNMMFCGTGWDKVVCSQETHCPTGTECKNGEICYTKYQCNAVDFTKNPTHNPTTSPILPYDHPSYYKFCGTTFRDANNNCNIERHCALDDDCPSGSTCFGDLPEHCNAFNMLYPELVRQPSTPSPTNRPTEPVPTQPPTPAPTASPSTRAPIQRSDQSNMRFCAPAWDKVVCSIESHCPIGTECTNGEICFTDSTCNILDLTKDPTPRPSSSPVMPRDDPSNFMFCGKTYNDAVEHCSLETQCTSNESCPAEEACFSNLPGHCNAIDMTMKPTQLPTTMRPTQLPTKTRLTPSPITPRPTLPLRTRRPTPEPDIRTFRPTSPVADANEASSLDKPSVLLMPKRTFRPTHEPSSAFEVDEPSLWCGKNLADAENNCGSYSFYSCGGGGDFTCPFGWTCFVIEDHLCGSTATAERTKRPTPYPIKMTAPPTRKSTPKPVVADRPSKQPTPKPVTNKPTNKKGVIKNPASVSMTQIPSKPPTPKPLTSKPSKQQALKPVTDKPTNKAGAIQQPASISLTQRPSKHPTPKPLTSRPSKHPTPKPLTSRPSKQPTPKPLTDKSTNNSGTIQKPASISLTQRPSKPPTPKPLSNRPSKQPTLKPIKDEAATSLSQSNKHEYLLTPSPTQTPTKISVQEPELQANKQNNQGKGQNPSEPSPVKDSATAGKENEEEKPSLSVGLLTTTTFTKRHKLYCFSRLSNFDEGCVQAMECNAGIKCPSGNFCLQYDCENRPLSNGELDLCPYKYVGQHTKDCKSYYECDHQGYVGPAYTCEEGFKFDKLSGHCTNGYLVDSQCHRTDSFIQTDSSDESYTIADQESVTYESFTDTAHPPSKSSLKATSPPTSSHSLAPTFSRSPTPTSDVNSASSYDVTDSSTLWNAKYEPDLSQWYTSWGERSSRSMNVGWLKILALVQFTLFSFAM